MRFPVRLLALLTSLVLLLTPSTAWAYSYGPAETEPIAEAYTAAVAAANAGDWTGAAAAFDPVRAEVEKDAGGPEAVAAWETAVAAQNPEVAAQVFRGIVYLNLKRRLTYARQAIEDYPTAKTLVNRATTTYEAMSPLVAGQDPELDTRVRRDLDEVFHALGNPGVLGVGARDPDPVLYDAAMARILESLQPLFPTDFAAMAAAAQGGPEEPPADAGDSGDGASGSAEGGGGAAGTGDSGQGGPPSTGELGGTPGEDPGPDEEPAPAEPGAGETQGDAGDAAEPAPASGASDSGGTQTADASGTPDEEPADPAAQDTAQAESQTGSGAWIWLVAVAVAAGAVLILYRRLGRGA